MNREIKFRAWDGKRMTTSGIMFNTSTGFLEVPKEGSFGSTLTMPYYLMQFTGLKDKNGKEIYEGDHFGEPAYPVEFFDGAFFHEGELLRDTCGGMEVAGNIYENPELL